MRLVTTFIQNTESTDPDLSYLNRARFVLSVADGHGSDGVGILDAVIRNRHLFLSMTSGAEIDAGSVFTEDDLPVASDSRLGIAAFDPAYFSILAGKVSLRGDLDFGLNETQLAEYLTANKYATQAWVAAQGFIGSDGLALYATKEWVLGQNFAKASSLGNYLLKSVWDEVFEVTTVNGVRVLNVKLDIAGLKGISAYGLGSTSGGSASGSLGELVNVGQWADAVPTADRVMVQLAGATHWSAKPLADLVGLDTAALAQYLTANSYLKASDISSYLTWANLSGKPTVYPTSWANIADKPTVYPTTWTSVTGRPTKLSQFTDDVVAGNYLPKPTWDAVFEVVTVDGTPALKVKYDILGLKGITAYADGSLSGGFSGALVDLVDVAVTNLASGDILKYNGTHFVNVPVSSIAGASSWDQITGKPDYFPTRWADVSGAPTSFPASDVYPWAKAASKPTYTAAEVGAVALNGGGDVSGSINASAYLTANTLRAKAALYPTISFVKTNDNSESLLIVAGNNLYYRPVASDATNRLVYHSGNFNPSSKLDKSVWDEAFELKTVNGVRVISAKLDFLSVAGISAYATGPSSGGGGGGLDYDLLKQALTGAITPDGYPFTISASFLGAIDKTYLTGKLANTYADKVHTHLWSDITDRPTSLPANGGNADTVDNLHASSFTRADQSPNVDLNTVNGQGIMACGLNEFATAERHYPIQQAGTLFYGTAAYNSACQIYGTFQYNRWFVRGGGTSQTAKTPWAEIWTTVNFNPDNYLLKTANAVSASKWATARTLTLTGSAAGSVSIDGSANVSLSVTNNRLNSNSEMTYGWNGLNYFNLAGTAGAAAKINDTPTTAWWHILRFNHGNSAGYYTDLAVPFNDNTLHYKRVTSGTLQNGGWVKIWDAKNSNLSTVDWSANNLNAAANLDVAGQAYVSGWLRSRGNVGWYSQDYGGGIYMTDSTWVRVYGSKGLMIDTGTSHINMGQLQIACSAEASIGFRSASNGNWCLGKGVSSIGSGFGLYNAATNRVAFQIASATDAASFASSITAAGSIVSMSTVESRGDNSTGILPQMLWHIPGVTYARIRMASNGTLHVINGASEAYHSLYAQSFVAAGNVTAADTVTATKLVIGGITIDVYNGALRVNGNLVATGGVTSLATA